MLYHFWKLEWDRLSMYHLPVSPWTCISLTSSCPPVMVMRHFCVTPKLPVFFPSIVSSRGFMSLLTFYQQQSDHDERIWMTGYQGTMWGFLLSLWKRQFSNNCPSFWHFVVKPLCKSQLGPERNRETGFTIQHCPLVAQQYCSFGLPTILQGINADISSSIKIDFQFQGVLGGFFPPNCDAYSSLFTSENVSTGKPLRCLCISHLPKKDPYKGIM